MSGIPDKHKPAVRFLGDWKATAQDGFPAEIQELNIDYRSGNQTPPFQVELIDSGSPPQPRYLYMDYEKSSDTLQDSSGNMIGFWRNPSADILFATFIDPTNQQNNPILTARRIEISARRSPAVHRQQWIITNSNGHHAPAKDQFVSLRKITVSDSNLEMYGLYWSENGFKPWHLYDMVYYRATRASFLSVFGVRMVKILPNGGIFASFDNRYSTPSGFMGGGFMGSDGGLNLFGESQDPDAGCWCGEPFPQGCP